MYDRYDPKLGLRIPVQFDMATRELPSTAPLETRARDDQHLASKQRARCVRQSARPICPRKSPSPPRCTFESPGEIASLPTTKRCSRQPKLFPNGCMTVHAPTSEVRKASLNFLADVDSVHEIVPRRRLREASNELDGLRLNALSLRGCSRHGAKLGTATNSGKRVFAQR
jgi:hypothetical protein